MCGLAYCQSFNGATVNELVWKQFESQRSRGTEGFGFFNGRHIIKAATEKRIKHQLLKKKKNQTDLLLFHHRWPTSTVNEKKGAHPYNTGSYFGDTKYVLVHNGKIRNSHDLREQHELAGISYQSVFSNGSFNDSESLLWDFALTMEGKQDKLKAYGDIAFICIKLERGVPTKLYYGRNWGRPLKMARNKLGMMLSSEGAGDEVPVHELYTYNYQAKRLTHKPFKVHATDPEFVYQQAAATSYRYYGGTYSNSSANTCGAYDSDRWDDDYYHIPADSKVDDEYEEDLTYETWNADTGEWDTVSESVTRPPSPPTHISQLLPASTPSDEEVLNLVWQELAYAEGHFHTAYWALERTYDVLEQKPDKSMADLRRLHLLSQAVDRINDMDGYDNENSIHTMWANQQRRLEGVTS